MDVNDEKPQFEKGKYNHNFLTALINRSLKSLRLFLIAFVTLVLFKS